MMKDVKAPAHLPDKVLEQARNQQTATPVTSTDTSTNAPTFSVKRFRYRKLAVAACAALLIGVGLLAAGPISAALGQGGGIVSAPTDNFFQMTAFADEGTDQTNGPVTLSAEDFLIMRSSVGYVFHSDTGETDLNQAKASRSYNLDLTCTGDNVTSMTYELQGEGVKFFNWELTYEGSGATSDGPTITGAKGDNNNSFTVDYSEQDIDTAEAVHHEIYLNYLLDDAQKALWDKLNAAHPQNKTPRDSLSEAELAPIREASDRLDLALAQHDAEIMANARLVLTATFSDGTTQTKTYRIAPVDDFETAYRAYLDTRFDGEGTAAPDRPVLYTIEEVV